MQQTQIKILNYLIWTKTIKEIPHQIDVGQIKDIKQKALFIPFTFDIFSASCLLLEISRVNIRHIKLCLFTHHPNAFI